MSSTFALIGDIAYNGLISQQSWLNVSRYAGINKILNEIDVVFANLEVPVRSGNSRNEFKIKNYYSDIDVTKSLLRDQNIGCVSLANNHVYDLKMPGLIATIETLDELEILHTGAGWKAEHIEPVIIKQEDRTLGFIAYVDKSTNPMTEHFPELYINYLDLKLIKQDIAKIRGETDIIICSIHWGSDYSFYPVADQLKIAHELADSGVDIIMGHHPHTIQPFEKFNNSYIFYSLGGLTYGDDFINGEMRALMRKSKESFIPVFKGSDPPYFVTTKELEGNIIEIDNWDVVRWSHKKWQKTKLIHKSKILSGLQGIKENVLDKIHEYFFGYYRCLPRELLSFGWVKKIPGFRQSVKQ